MDKLPNLALRLIYEYDNTYREKYDKVVNEFNNLVKKKGHYNVKGSSISIMEIALSFQ